MPDEKLFAKKLLAKGDGDGKKGFSGERQPTAQSFNLHVEFKDGRRARGFAMSHFSDYEWTDEGEMEKLVILFGMRAVTVEGQNLDEIVALLQNGRLTSIEEMTSRQVQDLKHDNPGNKPIVMRVTAEPEFKEILNAIRGEEEHETGFAKRVRG